MRSNMRMGLREQVAFIAERFGPAEAIAPLSIAREGASQQAGRRSRRGIVRKESEVFVSDIESPGSGAIAIIGLSGRFPDAPNADALWQNLLRVARVFLVSAKPNFASGVEPQTIRNPAYVPAAAVLDWHSGIRRRVFSHDGARGGVHRSTASGAAGMRVGSLGERRLHRHWCQPTGRVCVGAGASAYWAKYLATRPEVSASVPISRSPSAIARTMLRLEFLTN